MTASSTGSHRHGPGHYDRDRTFWCDHASGRWYPVGPGRDELDIELQDAGATSWHAALLTVLGSVQGGATLRFVGRVRAPDRRDRPSTVRGDTFLRPRSLPDDVPPDESYCPGMDAALRRLRERLEDEGWLSAGRGREPWSYHYVRPRVRWDHPVADRALSPGD